MMNEVTITIVTTGSPGTGKTRAIDAMVAALVPARFEIVAGTPKQELYCAETYTFKARLR